MSPPLTTAHTGFAIGTAPRGQFVLEDAHKPGSYLGVSGWSTDRATALSFGSADAAREALAGFRRQNPQLVATRMIDVVERAFDPDLVIR